MLLGTLLGSVVTETFFIVIVVYYLLTCLIVIVIFILVLEIKLCFGHEPIMEAGVL